MPIPSYDDLAPSIPDITPRDTRARLARLLPLAQEPSRGGAPLVADPAASAGLFACLRSTRPPGMLMAVAREFSPRIERHGAGSVVLDVSGLGRLLGDAAAIGEALARAAGDRASGIRVGVAPTRTAARLLTIAHPRLVVVARETAAALAPLPLRTLGTLLDEGGWVPGDSRAQAVARARATATRLEAFQRWGLATLGDMAALPADALAERMGQEGVLLQRLARGADVAPLVPDPGTPRFLESIDLEWPIDTLEPLSFVLARLLDPLSAALERADRGAAALRLDLRLVDRTTFARVLQLPAAMRDPRVLRTLLLLDLESHPPPAAIDVVTLELDPAPARIIQYSLLERALPSVETLATLMARLGALVGDTRCGSPALLDTHRPDGFEMRRFAPDTRSAGPAGPRVPGAPEESPAGTARPPVLRRFRPAVAVRVVVERGRPVRIAIDRRGMPGGDVAQQAGPWRTSGAWWDGAAWDRDEWDVALSDGSLCRLFRDRQLDRWFLEGLFD